MISFLKLKKRWVIIGPSRSGTGIHIDPLGTSAWNALISGHKWWVMLPTDTPKHMITVPKGEGQHQSGEGIQWFQKVYNKIKSPTWPKEYKPVGSINFGCVFYSVLSTLGFS